MGKDARARGVNILLGPGVNIARSPIAGRNFEYLSEDPFLNAALVVPFIEGVQSQGVVATVKHYALNNQEYNRHNVSVDIDERTMREIYLPPFEAAITKAHVDAVMSSYNLVNGVHATQNAFLNLKVLKGDWGFKGILMSDWGATYDGVAAANSGLDLEMPSPRQSEGVNDRRQSAPFASSRTSLRLHRTAAMEFSLSHLLCRRPRHCTKGRARRHHAAEE
jgi:beta-glucosidase